MRPVSLKSHSKGNILHLGYGDLSKLLFLEVLCAAAKSRTIHWCSRRTHHLIKMQTETLDITLGPVLTSVTCFCHVDYTKLLLNRDQQSSWGVKNHLSHRRVQAAPVSKFYTTASEDCSAEQWDIHAFLVHCWGKLSRIHFKWIWWIFFLAVMG